MFKKKFRHPKQHGEKKRRTHQQRKYKRTKEPPLFQDHILQQTIGNIEVHRLFEESILKASLFQNPASDKYEKEADNIAQQVTGMGDTEVHKIPNISQTWNKPQRKGMSSIDGFIETKINAFHNPGEPIQKHVRDYFQPRFGVDLGNVRIHKDSHADRLAKAIHARAFTLGNDIVFSQGQYQPETTAGKKLIAHELTHVLQQKGNNREKNVVQRKPMDMMGISKWYSLSSAALKYEFEKYCAELLKPMLLSAIEISKKEKEKYFGKTGRIDELVNCIKDNYGQKYHAADVLRARALIRFHKNENVVRDMGLRNILHIPEFFNFNEEDIAENLLCQIKNRTFNTEGLYDPRIIKEIMAAHIFEKHLLERHGRRNDGFFTDYKNAPFSVMDQDDYMFDMDAFQYVTDNYPELYQADMLDASTTGRMKGHDVAEYPVLSDIRTDFYQMSKYPKGMIKDEIKRILDEREGNSRTLYDKISGDTGIIWQFEPLIEYALKDLGFSKENGQGKIIWDEFKQRELSETILSWILAGLGILIGIAGAVTGGLGYGAAALIFGAIGAGLSLLDLCMEINEYSLFSAASESTYDIVLSERPSPIGIFVAIAGLVLDIADVAGGAGKLIKEVAEEVSQKAVNGLDEAEDALRQAHSILTAKGIIKNIDVDEFIKAVKNATDQFPKAFAALPQTPAFYKTFAKDPAGFAKLLAEGKEEVLDFFKRYGSLLNEDDIIKCINEGPEYVNALKNVMKGKFPELISALDELHSVPKLTHMNKGQIQELLKGKGFKKAIADNGGEIWTKPMPDGNTIAIRIDRPDRSLPADYLGAKHHVHKEIVPSDVVVNGRYPYSRDYLKFDDDMNPATTIQAEHILYDYYKHRR